MNSNAFFSHFKSFAYDIQSDISKIKKSLESGKLSTNHTDILVNENDENFVLSLNNRVIQLNQDLLSLETKVFGPAANRLSFVTMDEIHERSNTVFDCNEKLIQTIKVMLNMSSEKEQDQDHEEGRRRKDGDDMVISDNLLVDENQENVPPMWNEASTFIHPDKSILSQSLSRPPLSEVDIKPMDYKYEDGDKNKNNHQDSSNSSDNGLGYFEVEYDLKSERSSRSPQYISPIPQQINRFSFGEVESKTPTLADWKLSDATKALVYPNHRHHHHHRSYDQSVSDDDDDEDEGIDRKNDVSIPIDTFSDQSISDKTPASPSDLNLSMTTQMITNIRLEDFEPTPGKELKQGPNSLLLSPSTPGNLTPFQTCTLKDKTDNNSSSRRWKFQPLSPDTHLDCDSMSTPLFEQIYEKKSSHFDMSDEIVYMENKRIMREEPILSITAETEQRISSSQSSASTSVEVVDYSSDKDQSIEISPMKIAKVLKPRTTATVKEDGWIPLIQSDQWITAPAFLQKQVTIVMLNQAIEAINDHIDLTMDSTGNKIESISQPDIATILAPFFHEFTAKTIVMAIVYLKRLDIATEGGVKHYKIKRFY